MYTPNYFKKTNANEVFGFIKEFNFGTLVSSHNGLPVATHIPFEVQGNAEQFSLFGHIAKGNKQGLQLEDGSTVLAIFQGPHSYVSPSWYTAPNVPTWNYIAVHVYAKPRIVNGSELYQKMQAMVAKYEAPMQKPMLMEHLDEDYITKHLNAITAFELKITEVQASYKLSQNRDAESHQNIINQLQTGDENAQRIAAEMEKTKRR